MKTNDTTPMKKRKLYRPFGLWIMLAIVALTGCQKKELSLLSELPDRRICHTTIALTFNTDWDSDVLYEPYTRSLPLNEGLALRCIVEFWIVTPDGNLESLVERREINGKKWIKGNNSLNMEIDLPPQRIAALCWAEPLPGGSTLNPYFKATDLRLVELLEPYGQLPVKDAFTNCALWDFTSYQNERNRVDLNQSLALLRPFGRYSLIANDIKEYQEKQGADAPLPVQTKISYQLWIPAGYDVFHQIAIKPVAEAGFTSSVWSLNENELTLGEDFLFIGTKDTGNNYFNLTVNSYAADGKVIKESGNVGIRVQRNKQTLVTGAFLTDRHTNAPGIDDSFDDEIIVVIPD